MLMNTDYLSLEKIHLKNKRDYFDKFCLICFSISAIFAILNIFTKFYVAVAIDALAAAIFYALYLMRNSFHQKPYLGSLLVITCCLQLFAQTIILEPGTHHNLVFFPAVAIFIFTLTDSRKRILCLISFCALSLISSHLVPFYFNTSFIPLTQMEKHFYMIICGIATLYATFMIGKSLIDEKVKAIKNLESLTDQLKLMTSKYEKLIEVAIHDIASPMTVINLKLRQHKDKIPETLHESLYKQVDKLMGLIHDTRLYYNMDKKNVTLLKEKICINDVVKDCLAVFAGHIEVKKLDIKLELLSNSYIYANNSFLKSSVISNFLSNAIKFSDEKSHIDIATSEDANSVILKISNFGRGLSEEQIDKILAGDKKETTLGTKGEVGQGLGLGIALHFINEFEGHLECESKDNQYTTFILKFPKLKHNFDIKPSEIKESTSEA